MSASIATATARSSHGETLRYFFWSHPEWWSVALCGSAWLVLLVAGWQHAGHERHHRMTYQQELRHWMWMVAAMMLPLCVDTIRWTAESSLWRRRHRAIAGFLVGYGCVWVVFGLVAAGLRQFSWAHTPEAAAVMFLGAAWWQRTWTHRRSVVACHRTYPLAPLGWTADRDCARFGGLIGADCVRSCWPVMLACTFAGHGAVALMGGLAVGVLEREFYPPRERAVLFSTLALAGYYAILAVLPSWGRF